MKQDICINKINQINNIWREGVLAKNYVAQIAKLSLTETE